MRKQNSKIIAKNMLVHPAGSLHWNDLAPMALVLFVGEFDVEVNNPHRIELFDMVLEVPGGLLSLVGGGVERPSRGKPYSHLNSMVRVDMVPVTLYHCL